MKKIGALLTLLIALAAATPAAATPTPAPAPAPAPAPDPAVVEALDRAAHPLRTVEPGGDSGDLRPLDRMIGDARVVGLGEATHSSHDFFALKDRVFRHLVEEKGFRTFALEAPWSTGLRLDDYVLHGKGDVRRIVREEFQRDYLWWNNTDYLRLLEWMRAFNVRHPGDPVRFMGDDIAWTGPESYDAVAAAVRPALRERLAELYRGLRPTVGTGAYIDQYLAKPYAERKLLARHAADALELVRDAGVDDLVLRNATAIDQTARQYAFDFEDPAQVAAAMRYRDETMAANVVRWQRYTGTKVLLAAHNNHIGYVPDEPADYPKVQGEFLRETLGAGYVSIGLTFDHGSFNATGQEDETVRRWTLGPADPGSNERTLDRVRHRDYVLDLRSVGSPAREWLLGARPTRSIGTAYPDGPNDTALARTYDLLVHLHRVEAARLRDR
ncbi:erythromycin esterase family protein [Streptomyces sp. S.PB5]|uniref:erythromycin esterase family protein n=1 Tax=Streptomyces sp. S.PB5 TaxID=3020844 RepID=UPI0025AF8A4B|nr:erythromycin esterase family protein [Streptomyces sp. S.PB5]MDN3026874.1 erythromycin esterase family protein [Streptomyces sp. S.PB5]